MKLLLRISQTVLASSTAILPLQLLGQAADSKPLATETFKAFELRNVCPSITPARIADIAIDPRDSSVWYVATAASGVWKTSNRGLNWTPICDEIGSSSFGCITLDPKNPDVVWLGSGENQSLRSVSYGDGLYKSTDAGRTWKKVGLGRSEHLARILIDPRNSDVVYVAAQGPLWAPGGDRGLYKTTDGGATWKPILQISENTGVTEVCFDSKNPDILYAAAYQRRRHVGLLIGGGPEAGIFKSTDAGATWKKLTNGLPAGDLGRIALAVSPQQPEVVYAAVTAASRQSGLPADRQSGFFRSSDSGETWIRQRDYEFNDPQFYGELYTDPRKFDRLYVIDTVILLTDDGGKTMNRVNWGIHVDNHAMALDPNDAEHWLVGNDGGMYETTDGGRTFRHFDNMPTQQFYGIAVDNALPFYNVYGGAQDNGSLGGPSRSTNRIGVRSSDWIVVGGGDGMQPRVDPTDASIVYAQSQNGALNRVNLHTGVAAGIRPRNDAQGVRWNWNAPLITSPHAPMRIYYAGSRIFRSNDRGTNWNVISPDLTRQLDRNTIPVMGRLWDTNAVTRNKYTTDLGVSTALAESAKVEGLLYVGTDDGLVQVSGDGGTNWDKHDTFPGVPEMAMVSDVFPSATDPDTVYASFNNYQRGDFKPYLLKSSNRGKDWVSIAANLPQNYPVWSIVEDPGNHNLLFAGTEFGLFFSIDGGKQWVQLKEGVPTTAFRDLEIQQRETDLVGGTFGRGCFILDDYTPLRHLKPEMLTQDSVLLPMRKARVYEEFSYARNMSGNIAMTNPPFGAMLTYYLRDDLSKDNTRIALAVADSTGKTIRQVNGPATAGMHRVNWNLRGDPSAAPAVTNDGGDREEEQAEEEEAEPQPGEAQQAQGAGAGERQGRGGEEVTTEEGAARGEVQGQADARRGGGARGGRGGRGGGRGGAGAGGPLVPPGKYTITLGKIVDGKLVPMGQSQTLEVIPLEGTAR